MDWAGSDDYSRPVKRPTRWKGRTRHQIRARPVFNLEESAVATVSIELECETCWCGMPFMLPKDLRYQAHNRGHTIYCPLGHTITWKETEETRLRRERDRLKQDAARIEDERRWAEERASVASVRAEKAERKVKKLTKRVAAGTCPCCQRTFSNMAEHMKHQHPEFVADTGAKVVPIKRTA